MVPVPGALLSGTVLESYEPMMRQTAQRYGLPEFIIPLITRLESSGGAAACGFNAWGYDSCHSGFSSWEEGIETVGATLASYGGDWQTDLCIWVSGHGCYGDAQTETYLSNARSLLGD